MVNGLGSFWNLVSDGHKKNKIEAKRTETIEPEVGNPPNKHFNMFLCAADIFLYTEAVR